MQSGTFRKNVMRTLAVKSAKLGLRGVAKNSNRTNLAHATVALSVHTGQVVQSLSQYVLGFKMSDEMKDEAFTAMGDVGYDLTILCRILKVKMPASTKKSKLVGTRTAALLQLSGQSMALLGIMGQGAFYGPAMKSVKKMVTMPNKGGSQELRDVDVVNVEVENAQEVIRQDQMKSVVSGTVDLYWRLSFDIFGHAPDLLFANKIERLKVQYPEIVFEMGDEEDEEAPQEAEQTEATATA